MNGYVFADGGVWAINPAMIGVVDAISPFPREDHFCRTGDAIVGDAVEIVNVREQSLLAGLHTLLARPLKAPKSHGFFGQKMFAASQFRERLGNLVQYISVPGISKGELGRLMLEISHPEEQRKIARFLGALDYRIDAVTTQITTAGAFKRASSSRFSSREIPE